MDSRNFDRRIGRRHNVDGVPIGWYVGAPGEGDEAVSVTRSTGYLVDVSATGAAVVAPHDLEIWIGCIVGFEFRGLQGTVRIRRIERTAAELDMRVYGIEFTAPSSTLVQGLCDTFLARHSGLRRWRDPRYAGFDGTTPSAGNDTVEPDAAPTRHHRGTELPAAIDAGELGRSAHLDPPPAG